MREYDIQARLGLPTALEALLARALGDISALFPHSLQAAQRLAEAAQRRWIAHAQGLPLPGGHTLHPVTGAYAESIQIRVENPQGDIRYVVFSNDPKAEALEYGSPAWDMHRVLASSRKVRKSKQGYRYLRIPIRGTPMAVGAYADNEMSQPVYSWGLKRDHDSFISSTQSAETPRYTYHWGSRLTARDIENLGLDPSQGLGRRMVGMVRRNQDQSLMSGYMTFRTLSEAHPEGWRHPGTPELRVAGAVYDWVRQIYPALMEQALDADLERIRARLQEGIG